MESCGRYIVLVMTFDGATHFLKCISCSVTPQTPNTPDTVVCTCIGKAQTWSMCNAGSAVAGTGISSYGSMFQWGRSAAFSYTGNLPIVWGPLTISAANATNNFIYVDWNTNWNDWQVGTTSTPWGGSGTTASSGTYLSATAGNQSLMKGPCANGYHVPTMKEWCDMSMSINGGGACMSANTQNRITLLIPLVGMRDNGWGGYSATFPLYYNEVYGEYWVSSNANEYQGGSIMVGTGLQLPMGSDRSDALSVRCLKN